MRDGSALPLPREALVDVSAAVAARDRSALGRALRLAAHVADPRAVDEVLLQSHLFVGFPLALEALILWRQVEPTAEPRASDESPEGWPSRGERVCRAVYGGNYERLRANVQALHPDLDQWMVVGGYGRVIGRPGLDLPTRELCVVALLAVWGAPRQLHSHLRGALNAGASPEHVAAAVEVACRYLTPPMATEILQLWAKISPAAPV